MDLQCKIIKEVDNKFSFKLVETLNSRTSCPSLSPLFIVQRDSDRN